MHHRVFDAHVQIISPTPPLHFPALHSPAFFQCVHEGAHQHFVVIAEPAGRDARATASPLPRTKSESRTPPRFPAMRSPRWPCVRNGKSDPRNQRRGFILIHLAIPLAQQRDGVLHVRGSCAWRLSYAATICPARNFSKPEYTSFWTVSMSVGAPSLASREHVANLPRAIRRREIAVHVVGIIRRETDSGWRSQ